MFWHLYYNRSLTPKLSHMDACNLLASHFNVLDNFFNGANVSRGKYKSKPQVYQVVFSDQS